MFGKLIVKLTKSALKRADLSMEDRNLLTTLMLDKLGALPIRDMITTNEEGKLLVNGRRLDIEVARKLRENARMVLSSTAYKFVREQVAFAAITHGVHKLETVEQSMFSRAALWYGQQETDFLKLLAGNTADEELDLDD